MNEAVVRQLTFIRFLYLQSTEHSTKEQGWATALALLLVHDAVELFLVQAVETLHINTGKNPDFMKLWGDVDAHMRQTAKRLTHRQQLDKMNNLRNGLKHKGSLPLKENVDAAVRDSGEFLAASSMTIYDIDYRAVDPADLVDNKAVRESLRRSAQFADQDDFISATAELRYAFEQLTDIYTDRSSLLRQDNEWISSTLRLDHWEQNEVEKLNRDLPRVLNNISTWVTSDSARLDVISLGLNYPSYLRFNAIAPRVLRNAAGRSAYYRRDSVITRDDFEFCREFIISSYLLLSSNDLPSARPANTSADMLTKPLSDT